MFRSGSFKTKCHKKSRLWNPGTHRNQTPEVPIRMAESICSGGDKTHTTARDAFWSVDTITGKSLNAKLERSAINRSVLVRSDSSELDTEGRFGYRVHPLSARAEHVPDFNQTSLTCRKVHCRPDSLATTLDLHRVVQFTTTVFTIKPRS